MPARANGEKPLPPPRDGAAFVLQTSGMRDAGSYSITPTSPSAETVNGIHIPLAACPVT